MKKGFTLVELLAVIIVIGIVGMIIFPVVTKEISKSRQNLYKVQVENIKKAAKDMVLDDSSLLDPNHIVPTLISVADLQSNTNKDGVSYLESGKIKSPIDKSEMKGTVVITFDPSTNSYVYDYQEKSKEELSSLLVMPAAKTIISKQDAIYTNEKESGLFEDVSSNQYIFKGENPANFLRIGTALWRILSIDKDTYQMKVAKTTHNVKAVWSNDTEVENIAFSNTEMNIYSYLNSDFYNTFSDSLKGLVLENQKWNLGAVSLNVKEIPKMLQEEEKTSSFHANVGLVSVGDYAGATYDLSCKKDFTASDCAITNYLVLDKDYYLINTVKSSEKKVWMLSNEVGGLAKTDISASLNIIPVIYLKANAEVESIGVGTAENPYVLKLN